MGMHIGNSYRPVTFDCMETVGQRIRRLRKALGLNQDDLAEKLGVDQSTVSDIERGSGFSSELLMRMAEALESSAGLIMRGHDDAVWPFRRVPVEQFLALGPEDRAYVEGCLSQAIADIGAQPVDVALQTLKAARFTKKKPTQRKTA